MTASIVRSSLLFLSLIAAFVLGGAGASLACDAMKSAQAEQEVVCSGAGCAQGQAVTGHHQPECDGDDCVSKDAPKELPPVASRD